MRRPTSTILRVYLSPTLAPTTILTQKGAGAFSLWLGGGVRVLCLRSPQAPCPSLNPLPPRPLLARRVVWGSRGEEGWLWAPAFGLKEKSASFFPSETLGLPHSGGDGR